MTPATDLCHSTLQNLSEPNILYTHTNTGQTVTDDLFRCHWKGQCTADLSSQCDRRLKCSHGALFPGLVPTLFSARPACCPPPKRAGLPRAAPPSGWQSHCSLGQAPGKKQSSFLVADLLFSLSGLLQALRNTENAGHLALKYPIWPSRIHRDSVKHNAATRTSSRINSILGCLCLSMVHVVIAVSTQNICPAPSGVSRLPWR